MSNIAYLCEHNKRDELIEEVSDCADALGRTAEEIADGFIEAHKTMRANKEDSAFKVLNEITDTLLTDNMLKNEMKMYDNAHICEHGNSFSNCAECERVSLEKAYKERKRITRNDIIRSLGYRGES
tara:strand:- start:14409 stop:14786 length:378 start_codon:yes stop_codon:yes gene_type:complete